MVCWSGVMVVELFHPDRGLGLVGLLWCRSLGRVCRRFL